MWHSLCVFWDAIRLTVLESYDQYLAEKRVKETRTNNLIAMLEMID